MPIEHHEMDCKCGCGLNNVDEGFLKLLNEAQIVTNDLMDYYVPFKINSGCRCAAHNEDSGGSKKSAHLDGFAADIAVRTSRERMAMIRAFQSLGINRIGTGKNFIHIDIHPEKISDVWWTY